MSVLDTNVSRSRHRAHVAYVSPVFGTATDSRSGYRYTCPRCGWPSRTMKWRLGAEHQADKHALICPTERAAA